LSKKIIIVDSSSLIALERGDLIRLLDKIDYDIRIPESVLTEIGELKDNFKNFKIENLSGKTKETAENFKKLEIGKGEAECIALSNKLNLRFIICDDIKLTRQLFFSNNEKFKSILLFGFSFFLHNFYKKGLIKDIWPHFFSIIKECNWERSEVSTHNYAFLKKMGY